MSTRNSPEVTPETQTSSSTPLTTTTTHPNSPLAPPISSTRGFSGEDYLFRTLLLPDCARTIAECLHNQDVLSLHLTSKSISQALHIGSRCNPKYFSRVACDGAEVSPYHFNCYSCGVVMCGGCVRFRYIRLEQEEEPWKRVRVSVNPYMEVDDEIAVCGACEGKQQSLHVLEDRYCERWLGKEGEGPKMTLEEIEEKWGIKGLDREGGELWLKWF